MRYFFLIYALIAALIVGIFGIPGQVYNMFGLEKPGHQRPPLRLFPDMDEQDKVKAQTRDQFFANGLGSRLPAAGSQPRGFNSNGDKQLGNISELEFGGQGAYYYSGMSNGQVGSGYPEELAIKTEADAIALVKRGQERYNINCSACHGSSGNGLGMTSHFGVPGIANLHMEPFHEAKYPNGKLFETISKGKGNMSGYAYNLSVRDRWAIVAYVRTLQAAKAANSAK